MYVLVNENEYYSDEENHNADEIYELNMNNYDDICESIATDLYNNI